MEQLVGLYILALIQQHLLYLFTSYGVLTLLYCHRIELVKVLLLLLLLHPAHYSVYQTEVLVGVVTGQNYAYCPALVLVVE